MEIELITYIATFIISSGLAVIGISISYQLYQNHQKQIFQMLLYQQIFLFSFFLYGIWGNLIIREIVADFNFNSDLNNKIAVFIPFIGIPFLVLSWFMLVKLGFSLNETKLPKIFAFIFFPVLILTPIVLALFIQVELIGIPSNPDLFIIQLLLIINLIIHGLFLIPQYLSKGSGTGNKLILNKKYIFIYVAGVVGYSLCLNFFSLFGYISTCFSILLLFGINILLPLFFHLKLKIPLVQTKNGMDFKQFCSLFEISKRESEIVAEICSGKTNKAISEKLFITLQTVKDHTHRIYTKTGVKSRIQLANLVREKTGS